MQSEPPRYDQINMPRFQPQPAIQPTSSPSFFGPGPLHFQGPTPIVNQNQVTLPSCFSTDVKTGLSVAYGLTFVFTLIITVLAFSVYYLIDLIILGLTMLAVTNADSPGFVKGTTVLNVLFTLGFDALVATSFISYFQRVGEQADSFQFSWATYVVLAFTAWQTIIVFGSVYYMQKYWTYLQKKKPYVAPVFGLGI